MRLSRQRIVEVATDIVVSEGTERLTARHLGEVLQADPTSLYRHFASMDELAREIGDRLLGNVDVGERRGEPWRDAVVRICSSLRRVQITHPRLAVLVQATPTRLTNETAITEALLRELCRSGLAPAGVATLYHSVVELTVGSATIDAPVAALPAAERRAAYDAWRRHYAALDEQRYPLSVRHAGHLYRGGADARFVAALRLILESAVVR